MSVVVSGSVLFSLGGVLRYLCIWSKGCLQTIVQWEMNGFGLAQDSFIWYVWVLLSDGIFCRRIIGGICHLCSPAIAFIL